MSTLRRLIEVDGFALDVEGEEPRIRDVELGELLGYSRPRDIKPLIERNLEHLPGILRRGMVSRRGFVEEIGEEFVLTEAEALFVAARSETAAGAAVLKRLISLFVAVRTGLVATTSSMTPEAIALIASKVAAETTHAILKGTKRGRKRLRAAEGQESLLLGSGESQGVQGRPRGLGGPSCEARRKARLDRLKPRILEAIDASPTPIQSASVLRRSLRARHADLFDAVRALIAEGTLKRIGFFGPIARTHQGSA